MCNNFINITLINFVFCVNAFVYLTEEGLADAVAARRAAMQAADVAEVAQTTAVAEVAQTTEAADVDILIEIKMNNNFCKY